MSQLLHALIGKDSMLKWTVLAIVLTTFLFAGCGTRGNTTDSSHPTVVMSASQFVSYTSWTIKVGQSILFNDPSDSGGNHILVTGTSGNYISEPGAPDDFNNPNGLTFNNGDSHMEKFTTSGIYTITCVIHDSMIVTITVEP